MRAEINKIDWKQKSNRKNKTKQNNDTKNWFFKKLSKISKSPVKLTKHETKQRRHRLLISGLKQDISLQILKTLRG